ncbi:MAG: DUF1566 domain-containing protein [Crocinitomicaceae bacterium]|nr:DUF1566 domain-containing protein [Crocinitomicaceae bacterium]
MEKVILFIVIAFTTNSFLAQVGINSNGATPDPSAGLDIDYTDKGLLPPRLTTAQRTAISNPADGLVVYDTDVSCLFFYQASTFTWVNTCNGGAPTRYIGELYGGGVVFWVDGSGEHGLVVSMIDLSSSQAWSNIVNVFIGTTDKWDGISNTTAIIGQSGHTNSAAKLCADYTNADYGTGTYSDWYLPSIYELNYLWNNIWPISKALALDGNAATTLLVPTRYWSSSEDYINYSWFLDFFNGSTSNDNKIYTYPVRAIRAF